MSVTSMVSDAWHYGDRRCEAARSMRGAILSGRREQIRIPM